VRRAVDSGNKYVHMVQYMAGMYAFSLHSVEQAPMHIQDVFFPFTAYNGRKYLVTSLNAIKIFGRKSFYDQADGRSTVKGVFTHWKEWIRLPEVNGHIRDDAEFEDEQEQYDYDTDTDIIRLLVPYFESSDKKKQFLMIPQEGFLSCMRKAVEDTKANTGPLNRAYGDKFQFKRIKTASTFKADMKYMKGKDNGYVQPEVGTVTKKGSTKAKFNRKLYLKTSVQRIKEVRDRFKGVDDAWKFFSGLIHADKYNKPQTKEYLQSIKDFWTLVMKECFRMNDERVMTHWNLKLGFAVPFEEVFQIKRKDFEKECKKQGVFQEEDDDDDDMGVQQEEDHERTDSEEEEQEEQEQEEEEEEGEEEEEEDQEVGTKRNARAVEEEEERSTVVTRLSKRRKKEPLKAVAIPPIMPAEDDDVEEDV